MADADKIKDVASSSAAMAPFKVWYRLYYENGEEIGEKSSIAPIPGDIDDLKKVVKQQYNEELQHCSAGRLLIYEHGTNVPVDYGNPIDPQNEVPVVTGHILVVVAPNKSEQSDFKFLRDIIAKTDFSVINLGEQMLTTYENDEYSNTAKRCQGQRDAMSFITMLRNLAFEKAKGETNFCCIFASSGTGKTQLAATASLLAPGVVYLYMSPPIQGDISALQKFYRPHVGFSRTLYLVTEEFRKSDFFLAGIPGFGASSIAAKIREFSQNGIMFNHPIVFFLSRVFGWTVETSSKLDIVTLKEELTNRAFEEAPLVFLDEVPPRTSDYFQNATLLRDLLRALGVHPILMSTHTGAQNALQKSDDSRSGDDEKWATIFFRLPPYCPPDNSSPYLIASERPLVSHLMNVANSNSSSLTKSAVSVQKYLQAVKPGAWTKDPVFQLCQLFRTEGDTPGDRMWHQIIGEHFGHFKAPNQNFGKFELMRSYASNWSCQVGMATSASEPILFLALTSWSQNAHLTDNQIPYFPLVDSKGFAISVREAYNGSSEYFQQQIRIFNPNAKKLSGDHLESLSLASITLASMEYGEHFGSGVCLPHFLSSVYNFMLPGKVTLQNLQLTYNNITQVIDQLNDSLKKMIIPPVGCADSHFDSNFGDIRWGKLKRPRDSERRDGHITDYAERPVLHTECKNLKAGVTKDGMEKIIKRIQYGYKVILLFASSLTNFFSEAGSWKTFADECGLINDYVAFLVLEEGYDPRWMTVESETITLSASDRTEYFFVVIVTGAVET